MRILGISSATKIISVGLIDDDRVLFEKTVDDIRAEKVILYVKEAGIKPDQIEGVAIAVGPGSYSGLRGGLAAAKSLAQVLKIPLVGISTLEAIAYNLIDEEGTISVVLDAKSDDYNFALFETREGKLKRLTDDLVLKLDEIFARTKGAHLCEGENAHPYGVNIAKLGLDRIKSGRTDDFLKLAPAYSHKPNIRMYDYKGG